MSLKDAEMHAVSVVSAAGLTAALVVGILYWTDSKKEGTGPALEEYEVIEATIAYRKTPQKQPQKKTEPPPVEKPEGVSRDENKKVEDKKPEDKKPPEAKPDPNNPFGKFTRPSEDTGPATKPDTGAFNGDESGFAAESKGDPWFGRVHRDMAFTFPEIAKAQSFPVGCIRFTAEGKIDDYKFSGVPHARRGDDDVQIAAEEAVRRVQSTRDANPEPVPTHLLKYVGKYLCFKFSVSSGL